MIEHIRRIDTNREALGLGNFNPLLESRIRSPRAEIFKSVLAQCSAIAWQRSLQHDLTSGILYRPQGTKRRQRGRQYICIGTLRILHLCIAGLVIGIHKEVPRARPVRPAEVGVFDVEWADDVGHAKTVQHILGRNVPRSPRTQVYDPTRLPVFSEPRPDPGGIPQKKLAGANRQFKCAVVDYDMLPMRGKQRVVSGPIRGIGDERRACAVRSFPGIKSEVPAPRVSQLGAESGRRSKRNLGLQRMVIGMTEARFHDGGGNLRIGPDKVFRKLPAIPENRSGQAGKKAALRVRLVTSRDAGIEWAIDGQRAQRAGQCRVASIRKVVSSIAR